MQVPANLETDGGQVLASISPFLPFKLQIVRDLHEMYAKGYGVSTEEIFFERAQVSASLLSDRTKATIRSVHSSYR